MNYSVFTGQFSVLTEMQRFKYEERCFNISLSSFLRVLSIILGFLWMVLGKTLELKKNPLLIQCFKAIIPKQRQINTTMRKGHPAHTHPCLDISSVSADQDSRQLNHKH